jgi:periplasmic protein TonB
MFDAILLAEPKRHRGRWAVVAVLALAELLLVRALDPFQPSVPVREHVVEVRLLPPRQALPPAPGQPAQAKRRPEASLPPVRAVEPRIQPREVAAQPSGPPTESAASGGGQPGEVVAGGGGAGGAEAGVIGGAGGGAQAAAPSRPALPTDLALVRAGLARKFVYPPEALRRHWEGRVVLAFTLHADGSLEGLSLRKSSGHALLDEAALQAARDAVPFEAPGVDVLVVVPVVYRLG